MRVRVICGGLLAFGWLLVIPSISEGGTADVGVGVSPTAPRVNVVLVHGILDTGRKFDTLVAALENAGCRCLAPSLTPNDCRLGVRDLTTKLAARIDARFGRAEPFYLVGFSLGGLVTRDYVQNFADPRRVRGVFLISTPNHGTLWARLSPNPNMRQLAPGSDFLASLNDGAGMAAWRRVPVASYFTPLDLMIVPAGSSRWAVGVTRMVWCPAHPLMVRDRVVVADICLRIRLVQSGKASVK